MKILIFIPARGGSKGIKNKNLVKIGKKKLIDYTLDTVESLRGNFFTLVSTDSKKILKHCADRGLYSSYLRPDYLSKDNSTIISATFHAIKFLNSKLSYNPEAVLLLQPTSPIRSSREINLAIKEFIDMKYQSLIGVTKMREHPQECIKLNGRKWKYLTKPSSKNQMRQKYDESYYFVDGSFYLAKTNFLKKHNGFISENKSSIYKFSEKYSIDIDDYYDLNAAKAILSKNNL